LYCAKREADLDDFNEFWADPLAGLTYEERVSDNLCAIDPWRFDRHRIVVGKRSGKKMVNCA
jgi:hypothetical protein